MSIISKGLLFQPIDKYTLSLTLEDDSKTGQLVLQTPVGSYEMRQKNSSNPIMVLQAKGRDLSQVKDREIAGSGQTGFTIVGQCDETMELLVTRTSSIDQSKPRGKWHEKFAKTR